MQFQKISIPTPWNVDGNSEGVGESFKPKYFVGRVWIFSGTTKDLMFYCQPIRFTGAVLYKEHTKLLQKSYKFLEKSKNRLPAK